LFDPSQRLFDCPRQTPISPVQTDLKLRLSIGVGLVNHISQPAPCRRHAGVSFTWGRRQLTLFLQQQSVVSLQVVWAHDPSALGGGLTYGSAILHPYESHVRNTSEFGITSTHISGKNSCTLGAPPRMKIADLGRKSFIFSKGCQLFS
jgi:hypothetical protein